MKLNIFTILVFFLFFYFFINVPVKAENINFNNDVYSLKTVNFSEINKGYENEYFAENEDKNNWTKMIGIYHYPEIKKPIIFAQSADKEIEMKTSVLLLKFVANKKQEKAILSFIDIGENGGKYYVEHNIYKYEPDFQKGMIILKYAKKYFGNSEKEFIDISHEIKNINDDLIEQIIVSPIPSIVEK